jgi:hypothetical protein
MIVSNSRITSASRCFILAYDDSKVNFEENEMNTPIEPLQVKQRQKRVSFPYISIADAVEITDKLKAYKGFGQIVLRDALMKMGYSPTSSSANRALSALVSSYRLLDQQGSKASGGFVQLTPLAKKILLHPKDSQERKSALMESVLNDDLMHKVLDKWSDGLPDRSDIIRELQLDPRFNEFTPDAAARFATVIQETFEHLDISQHSNGAAVQVEPHQDDEMQTPNVNRSSQRTPDSGTTEYALPLAGGKKQVVLRAPIGLTKKDFGLIIQWLNVIQMGLVEDEVPQESEGGREL